MLKLDSDLEIRWLPNGGRKNLAGEVRNNIVFIYDADYESALRTLRHELLDYVISKAIEPWKEITNRLILLWNEEAYRRKEEVVERLAPFSRSERSLTSREIGARGFKPATLKRRP